MRPKSALPTLFLVASILVASSGPAADPPVSWKWSDLQWTTVAEPKDARQAVLWGDPKTSAYGTMNRWKFGSKAASVARVHEMHFVILAGTFTTEIEGAYKEFGPGAYVRVPRGVKCLAGCEAAGECRFLMHQPGPADVVQ